ncbi:PD-(D/E)XK nuclease family protein [Halochromatium glycolicum]|jgi:hypothetical protein|uniref:DUF3782 domain-containing protein n=1 Tax=Halochromatium glycolicum TaxID=85075 RepID=A0AAJ0U8J4_9GAMM|nr:DUF3782 domain-containing protein [Halochromatium glycolicum]MBK1707310.1 hypothetical protein [Halochromatium glycolicum]
MLSEQLKEQIKRELPQWLRGDAEFRRFVLELARDEFADKQQTEGRFEAMLAELARDREEQSRRWEAQELKWEAQERKWETNERKWEAQERKWEANERKWEEETRAWRKHEEEVWAEIRSLREENVALDHRIDRTLGALGARWGLQSERAFRNALAGILEGSFGVEVLNINEYDDAGEVFGRPEQVELDVIIKNGLLIICELKSSIDKAAMYSFERKARFYEKRHGRTASRLMVISPMIDPRAQKVAERLGIETYSDSLDVETLDGNAEGVSASRERWEAPPS